MSLTLCSVSPSYLRRMTLTATFRSNAVRSSFFALVYQWNVSVMMQTSDVDLEIISTILSSSASRSSRFCQTGFSLFWGIVYDLAPSFKAWDIKMHLYQGNEISETRTHRKKR